MGKKSKKPRRVSRAKTTKKKTAANFICVPTAKADVFLKCYWNAQEQRYNLNCQEVDASQCKGADPS